MICLTVSLRGLPIWTIPEAQTLLEEPYGPEGRRTATGAAEAVWQSNQRRHNQDRNRFAPHLGHWAASTGFPKVDTGVSLIGKIVVAQPRLSSSRNQ